MIFTDKCYSHGNSSFGLNFFNSLMLGKSFFLSREIVKTTWKNFLQNISSNSFKKYDIWDNVEKWPSILKKSYRVQTANFLNYVWPFFNITLKDFWKNLDGYYYTIRKSSVHNARFLNYVWSFYNIMHERANVLLYMGVCFFRKIFCVSLIIWYFHYTDLTSNS